MLAKGGLDNSVVPKPAAPRHQPALNKALWDTEQMKTVAKLTSAALLFSLLGSAGALAQQHACHDDAFRFCGQDIPDHAKIHACLLRHVKHLSHHCRAIIKHS